MAYEKLTTDQRIQLIGLVKERPVLYDSKHKFWRSVEEKEHSWKEIAAECNATVIACKKAWKTLRDQYQRHLKLPKRKQKTYTYFNYLTFLGKFKRRFNQTADVSDFSDSSDFSEELKLLKPLSRKTTANKKANTSICTFDDGDLLTTSQSSDDFHDEVEIVSTNEQERPVGQAAHQVFSRFNDLINQRFELIEDDNDIFLRMLARKMKSLPEITKTRLQENFLEQVNYETLQIAQK
ncbi:uncharacterized protein LOC142237153 [Haematobia irritans]|uniref:uncharacterized protein LOC142237153 n=1 Tax=Haematobia irritans TaxID=7368 RepID=UPI003F4FF6F2